MKKTHLLLSNSAGKTTLTVINGKYTVEHKLSQKEIKALVKALAALMK